MRISKGSDATRKKLAGWLVFSPKKSSRSTSDTPENSDSTTQPSLGSQRAPQNSEPSKGS